MAMMRQIGALVMLAASLHLLGGCATLGFYGQAVGGQLRVLSARQSVQHLLEAPETPASLRDDLLRTRQILLFAAQALGLPAKGRYDSFVATGRDAVVWNVFAAPELSLEPRRWCYPFAGCVPYRGYFRKESAQRHARRMRDRGWVVHVGGAAAYSTLGWFDDPLLDTFIDWSEGQLANLLMHELAHGKVWVRGDAAFNESLASFVGDAGARAWLADKPQALAAYAQDRLAEAGFERWLAQLRAALAAVYAADQPEAERRQGKAAVYAALRRCFLAHSQAFGSSRYARVVEHAVNNAYLASRSTYDRHVPAFARLFDDSGREWAEFWGAVDELAALPADARGEALHRLDARHSTELGQQQIADAGDDEDANEIQCHPFPGHGAGGDFPGTEHDGVGSGGHG